MRLLENRRNLYEKRKSSYESLCSRLEKTINSIGNWRLTAAVAGIVVATFAYRIELYYLFWSALAIFSALFIYLVVVHHRVRKFYKYVEAILKINDNSIKRLKGEWVDFQDMGEEFRDEGHEFSQDLDIFGRGSLFQWITTANTNFGRKKLKEILTKPCHNFHKLSEKQEAMNELGKKRWWRQKYQAKAMQIVEEMRDEKKLIAYMNSNNRVYARRDIIFIIRILPMITITTFLLAFGIQVMPRIIPVLAVLVHIVLLLLGIKKRNKVLKTIFTYQRNIKVYGEMLKHFEKTNFTSKYIKNLKDEIKNQEGLSAFQQLKKLEKLVDSISNRGNMLFLPINIIFLWDYQCMIALERWKHHSGHLIESWLKTLGEMESLSSLAMISFDYPHWTTPKFTSEASVLRARDLGHPLLTNKQVDNDLIIEEPKRILLITGSNMSGKSTLLRTAGINLVLAYAGAPVCAQQFECSFMRLFSCMRVSDNLEKSISSFYAELLRIKEIVKAAEEDRQVFFLLDEIFKGTNSHDRHLGAKMLINKLYKQNAIGLVSTHDLELGELEKESNGKVVNYHFQEYYKEDEIFFDYKLRRGVSTTRNALYLMKMAGIEN